MSGFNIWWLRFEYNHMYFFYAILQNGSEIFVMDIIDEVSSDILSNALRNISPEDKVSYTAHTDTRVIDFL